MPISHPGAIVCTGMVYIQWSILNGVRFVRVKHKTVLL